MQHCLIRKTVHFICLMKRIKNKKNLYRKKILNNCSKTIKKVLPRKRISPLTEVSILKMSLLMKWLIQILMPYLMTHLRLRTRAKKTINRQMRSVMRLALSSNRRTRAKKTTNRQMRSVMRLALSSNRKTRIKKTTNRRTSSVMRLVLPSSRKTKIRRILKNRNLWCYVIPAMIRQCLKLKKHLIQPIPYLLMT